MSSKEGIRRKQVLEEAKLLIAQIPAKLDRMEHYNDLASTWLEIDTPAGKECLELSMKSAVGIHNPELYSAQKEIIDLAYRLDPTLAASLASLADDDLARVQLKQRIQLLDLKKKMADQVRSVENFKPSSKSDYAEAAWMLLGGLNAGRVAPLRPDDIRNFLPIAAALPIKEAYRILAWVIENAKRRFSQTDQARTYLRPLYEATFVGAELVGRMAVRSSALIKQVKFQTSKPSSIASTLIRSGEREDAKRFLRDWFEREVQQYLKICDPYFGPTDLEILHILLSANPDCKVQVLTSRKHQEQEHVSAPWDESYRAHWRFRVSDQDPPDTEIFIIGTVSKGDLPIHDRWWLTYKGGIRLGTSFNSLGINRDSDISILSQEDAEIRERDIDQYLLRVKRDHGGDKLLYTIFTL